MAAQLRRIAILTLGWIFILLGIAGMFLPFLQGFLFLFIGLVLDPAQDLDGATTVRTAAVGIIVTTSGPDAGAGTGSTGSIPGSRIPRRGKRSCGGSSNACARAIRNSASTWTRPRTG